MAWGFDLVGALLRQHICRLRATIAREVHINIYTGSKPEVVMGGKVSSKMAAPAARVIQAVRPHMPLIKFPNRHDMARPNVQEALKTLAVSLPQHSAPAAAPPPIARPQVPLTPIPGTPDTLASIQQLTARYRRRPLTVEEMDYIQRGGPEWHGATQSLQPKSLSIGDQYVSLILSLRTREPNATWDII